MRLNVSIVAVAAVLGSACMMTAPVFAQQAAPTARPAQQQAAPAQEEEKGTAYSAEDARAVLNARLAALKTVLELTPEQEKLWPALDTAIRDIVKDAAGRREQRASAAPPQSFLDVLGRMADAEATRAKDLQRFVAAAKPLAAALSDQQKARIPAFLGMTDHGSQQPTQQLWIFEEEEG